MIYTPKHKFRRHLTLKQVSYSYLTATLAVFGLTLYTIAQADANAPSSAVKRAEICPEVLSKQVIPQVKTGKKVEISCYTPAESHGANGRVDGVSVATYLYPQGTWLAIEGIGRRRVDTVTSRKYAHRLDIWMSPEECKKWGLQYRHVQTL